MMKADLTPLKLYIKTFGCQMNEYDSQKMRDILAERYTTALVDDAFQADLIVVNTCSVRDKAEHKLHTLLGTWREYKQEHPHVTIAVGGCVASQEGKRLLQRSPHVDVVFGPQTLHRLPDLIEQRQRQRKGVVDISFPEIEKFDHLPRPGAQGRTAFVSIMEGCSKFCSFCIVPYTRGQEMSRPFEDVLGEVALLAEQGVREVTLLGQNVNDYQGRMPDGQTADLALLIHYIAALESIQRIRFTTSHPSAFSQTLIDAYAEEPKLAHQLHLPVQSGSDRILTLMKRGYTTLEFKDKMRRLRAVRPDLPVSSDFIVGFPGETQADFDQTMALVETVGFDQSFSFIYSPRPGTPAATLPDDTPMSEKKKRLHALQALLEQQTMTRSEAMLHQSFPVLVTGPSKKNPEELCGRTENNRIVNFLGPSEWIGQMLPVTITQVLRNSLRGRVA